MATLTELRSPSEKRDSPYRRSNKPLMEKRRRARINSCLTQLKALVLEAMRKDSTQYSKLEKADILEMTVKHLRNLQRQQVATSVSRDPNLMPKYRAGFNECAQEVVRYLGGAREVSDDIKGRLLNHLGNCMETLDKVQPSVANSKQQTVNQPINVHIPPQPRQINTGVPTVQSGYLLMPANVQTSPILVHSSQIVTVPQGQCNTSPFVQNNSAHQVASNTTIPFGQSRDISNENALPQSVRTNSKSTPTRTKASLKAYDTTVFKPVATEKPKSNSPPLFSQNSSFYSHNKDFISTCCRTPSPLKEERVWRPW